MDIRAVSPTIKNSLQSSESRVQKEKPIKKSCPTSAQCIFGALAHDCDKELNTFKLVNTYKRGQVIFYEGNHLPHLFSICSGQVKLFKSGSSGKQQILRICKQGDLLGCRCLFAEEPSALTAQAIEDSTLCVFSKEPLFRFLSKNTAILFNITKRLCKELGKVQQTVMDLVDKPVEARVARAILTLKETFGKTVPQGTLLTLPLTREELAEIVGTTEETTVRVLSKFRERGILSVEQRRIIIMNVDALHKAAGNNVCRS